MRFYCQWCNARMAKRARFCRNCFQWTLPKGGSPIAGIILVSVMIGLFVVACSVLVDAIIKAINGGAIW